MKTRISIVIDIDSDPTAVAAAFDQTRHGLPGLMVYRARELAIEAKRIPMRIDVEVVGVPEGARRHLDYVGGGA